MARNAARIGCVPMISRARSIMTASPNMKKKAGSRKAGSAGVAARCMELADHASDEVGGRSLGVGELVVEVQRLPFESAELVERLDLHPLHILHGSDKLRDTIDVRRIVRQP